MKRAISYLTIAAGILALTASTGGSFQRGERSGTRELEGSWRVTGDFPVPYEALVTYGTGGTLLETKFYLNEFVSTGHGEWAFAGLGKFNVTFIRLRRDSSGRVHGIEKVREHIRMNEPGTYTSTREVELQNFGFPENNASVYTEKTTATRIRVEE